MMFKRIFKNWGVRKKIFFTVLLSIALSIGLITTINYHRLSERLLYSTAEKVSIVASRTGQFTLTQINNQVSLLKAIAISDNIKQTILEMNRIYDLMLYQDIEFYTTSQDQAWKNHDATSESLVIEIYNNEISRYLRELQSAYRDNVEIFVTDSYGLNIAMTNRTTDYWQGDEIWWKTARAGKIYYSNPEFDESSTTWAMIVAMPIYKSGFSGEVIGVVRGTIDITSVFDSIFNIQIGDTGQGVFISNDGYIYHLVDSKLRIDPIPQSYQGLVEQADGLWVGEMPDIYGVSSIVALKKMENLGQSLGWVLVYIHKSEVNKVLFSTLTGNIIIALILMIVLGVFSLVVSNSILMVLQNLKLDAYRLVDGDYSSKFSEKLLHSNDPDISSLVDSFTKMKSAVQSRETALQSSEKQYRQLVETMSEGLVVIGEQGLIKYVNPRLCDLLGYSRAEILDESIFNFFPSVRHDIIKKQWSDALQGPIQSYESVLLTKDHVELYVTISTQRQIADDGVINGVLAVITDISDRKKNELNLKRKLDELAGLRKIDTAILEKSSLADVVTTVLDQFQEHLKADGAVIYVFTPGEFEIQYAAGYVFEQKIPFSKIEVNSECPKRYFSLKEGMEIRGELQEHLLCKLFQEKDFQVMYIMPILINAQLNGFVELVYHEEIVFDEEWHSFFNGLITQTAVGISKIELMDHLQVRNKELNQAYDAAIEGWAKALELRDKETKGHSDRVVEVSLKMAEKHSFSGNALENFRRGALLHDIGKMGIPDHILYKPGTLDEGEWGIMRKHPEFAYKLLSDIPFLKEAIEIPYYHHERWDGSGYPQGLQGEDIPLAARIFAVADVWDALTSDRPYRAAWGEADAITYLKENRGILFDPKVVDQFLSILLDEI